MNVPLVLALANPQKATVFWYVARGSGFVVYGLLTLAVCLGILMSLRWRSDTFPRIILEDLHPFIILTAGVFLAIHIVSVLLDTFVHFQIYQVLVPFTSSYRVIWLSLGIISMYLAMALAASSYLRRFIGYRAWRALHYGGFFAWLLALTHAVATGTDSSSRWAIAIYGGSALLVCGLLLVRFGGVPVSLGKPPRMRPRVVAALILGLTLSGYTAAMGPWTHGWSSRAQINPFHVLHAQAAAAVVARIPTFTERVSGSSRLEYPGQVQQGSGVLHMQLIGAGTFPVKMSYGLLLQASAGGTAFVRGVFSLAPTSLLWNCSGPVSYRPPNSLTSTCDVPGGQIVRLSFHFTIASSGAVTGSLGASTGSGAL